MPSIEENLAVWDGSYDWTQEGDEWSSGWGGSEAQWFGTLLPRLHAFIPAGTILEIAPGFGRWTNYLKDQCENLIVVDLAEKCIRACEKRFSSSSHITYHVNDGQSLDMIPDNSIDFVFSFDALVHVERDVMEAYLSQLANKLSPNGVGFIHHSNLGMYLDELTGELPPEIGHPHWRGKSMSAKLFEEYCDQASLQCISQEMTHWASHQLIDAISVFTGRDSTWARPNRTLQNLEFMNETSYIARLAPLYCRNDNRVKA